MTIISSVGLKKKYSRESKEALSGLNLSVEENTVFGFLGPNGAGKTTTIKILTGMMNPSGGKATVAREEVKLNSVGLRRKIGYLGQEPKMYGWMKGLELLIFVGKVFGYSNTESKKKANEMLDMAGLSDAANKKISAYSGGMLQRLGIAQALMGKPEVLFLDEPTSALDPIGRKEVLEYIQNLKHTMTIFMSTHILSDVERICDTVAIIDKGQLLVQDKMQELRKRFASKQIEIVFETHDAFQSFIDAARSMNWEITLNDELRKLTINSLDIDRVKHQSLALISSKHFSINKFEMKDAGLEDVFVKLVGQI
jgi:ABC-2 type transport system ATP-binding protein